jgi:hypothetical protein
MKEYTLANITLPRRGSHGPVQLMGTIIFLPFRKKKSYFSHLRDYSLQLFQARLVRTTLTCDMVLYFFCLQGPMGERNPGLFPEYPGQVSRNVSCTSLLPVDARI